MRFLYKENAPTVSTCVGLRRKMNFKEYKKEDVETVIANPPCSAVAFDDKRPIGIARIVGDGRAAFFIKDMVVGPVYQKDRIGNLLMRKLQEYLVGATCEGAYVGLMSVPNYIPFYKKYGLLERPCDGIGPSMVKSCDPCEVRKRKR